MMIVVLIMMVCGVAAILCSNQHGFPYVIEVGFIRRRYESFVRHAADDKDLLIQSLDSLEDPLSLVSWANVVFVTR